MCWIFLEKIIDIHHLEFEDCFTVIGRGAGSESVLCWIIEKMFQIECNLVYHDFVLDGDILSQKDVRILRKKKSSRDKVEYAAWKLLIIFKCAFSSINH